MVNFSESLNNQPEKKPQNVKTGVDVVVENTGCNRLIYLTQNVNCQQEKGK